VGARHSPGSRPSTWVAKPPALAPHISQQLTDAEELYLPTVALGELLFGLQRSGNDPRAKGPLERLLQDVVLIAPDDQTAADYARLKAHLAAQSTPIPENGISIPATAHRHGLPIDHDDAHLPCSQASSTCNPLEKRLPLRRPKA